MRPSNALNIGAAARAMANFGLTDLAAVAPYADGWREAHSAIYGSELLTKARVLTLEEAVADCHLVLGSASAHNRALRRTMVTLPALRAWLRRRLPKGGRVAVLFGAERNGLENAELDHCHALLRSPTVDDAPSMNLGQAVALAAYGFSTFSQESSVTEPDERLLEGVQVEGLVETAVQAMRKTGVNAHLGDEARRRRFRRGLLSWRMTRADASFLRGLLAKLMEAGD